MSRNATDGFTKARPWSVTLHDAMVTVLRDSRRECTPSEIAAGITDGDLYRKGDGSHPSSSQISARANNYPRLFYKNHTTEAWGLNDKGWKASMTDAEHDHGDGPRPTSRRLPPRRGGKPTGSGDFAAAPVSGSWPWSRSRAPSAAPCGRIRGSRLASASRWPG